jgi:hypothetical protein
MPESYWERKLLADVGRLDPVRRKMLKDMGIDVWLLREPAIPMPAAPADRSDAPPATAAVEATVAIEAGVPIEATVAAEAAIADSTPAELPSVTCLVSKLAVMLVDNTRRAVSGRLCKDLLAAATGEWSNGPKAAGPREIAFVWPRERSQAECWRAFKAFAEKQLAEPDVRVVLCSEALVERLPELGAGRELLALPEFSELDLDGKRALWRRMQALGT